VNIPVLVLVVADFGLIGALPRVFFKRGSFNRGWWLTSLPFWCCSIFLVMAAILDWRSWAGTGTTPTVLTAIAAVFAAASVGLIFLTIGTHRVPLSLWHQDDDAPVSIVTYGAYARIRHPFYSAFLLAFVSACLLFPSLGTVLPLAYALVGLNVTAAREERRLAASEFGVAYQEYMSRTGRFLPV
jgi:protein-S-isoprenylcysteine O-methyltransferase Ste14